MNSLRKISSLIHWDEHRILYICVGYYILMALITPGFFTWVNSGNLLLNMMPLLIVSIGQTYVMLTAGIDLSVTSVIALSSVVGGYCMSSDYGLGLAPAWAIIIGMLAMIFVGGLVGFFNGFAVSRLGMPSFMVTLTSMMFFSGLAIWLTTSQSIYNLPDAFVDLPYSDFLFIPIPLIIGVFVALIAWFLLKHTLIGAWIYAVGLNPNVAKISGVPTGFTMRFAYIFCGCCAAIASIFYTARLETGSPVMGQHILLDVIGAVVIGGTSLFGGKGKIQWTLYGVVLISLIDNSLNLLGLSYFVIMMVKGSVILLAAMLSVFQSRTLKAV